MTRKSAAAGFAALTMALPTATAQAVPIYANMQIPPLPPAPSGTPVAYLPRPAQLRPGAPINVDGDGSCTANFVFQDDRRHRYIATAGHCANTGLGNNVDRRVYAYSAGPTASKDGVAFGSVQYVDLTGIDISDPCCLYRYDFALIHLWDHASANSELYHFGGPYGVNEDQTIVPDVLHRVGWGSVTVPTNPQAKTETVVRASAERAWALGPIGVQASGGDSGGPSVTADKRAMGVTSAVCVAMTSCMLEGAGHMVALTRIAPQIKRAEESMRLDLSLVNGDGTLSQI